MPPQTAFGGMLGHLVELTSLVLRPEPLAAEIERCCKQAWKEALCPECGETAVRAGDDSPRVWCTNCRHTFTYTRNTPFEGCALTPGEIVIAFGLLRPMLVSRSHGVAAFPSGHARPVRLSVPTGVGTLAPSREGRDSLAD